MRALFCLGQHNALAVVQQELVGNERLFAFHDNIDVTCSPIRVVPIVESYGCIRASKSVWGKPKFGTVAEVGRRCPSA